MTTEDIVHLQAVDDRSRSNTKRLDSLEKNISELHRLTTSVEVIATQLEHQTTAMGEIKQTVSKLDMKVETLENKPGKRWEAVVEKVLLVIVGAAAAYIATRIGF